MGILVGTYSSIFVACPILIFWHDFMMSRKPAAATAAGRQVSIEKPVEPKPVEKKKVVRRS
jgi:hypothetical protein